MIMLLYLARRCRATAQDEINMRLEEGLEIETVVSAEYMINDHS